MNGWGTFRGKPGSVEEVMWTLNRWHRRNLAKHLVVNAVVLALLVLAIHCTIRWW